MSRRPPLPPDFYEHVVAELEELAKQIEEHPELNHRAAAKLREIARNIRKDAGLREGS